MADIIEKRADFSQCRKYRYWLERIWDRSLPALIMVMMNPSIADETANDPTVERCERRARMKGYGRLIVVNLMAVIETDSKKLRHMPSSTRFGPRNENALLDALKVDGDIICGWGKPGHELGPVAWFATRAHRANRPLFCLKMNADGSPAHPLYQPYSREPIWFAGKEVA
jgi:hypothetical protein